MRCRLESDTTVGHAAQKLGRESREKPKLKSRKLHSITLFKDIERPYAA